MTNVNKKIESTIFADRLAKMSADYLQEIMNGNFEISIDKDTPTNVNFTIKIGGLNQSSCFFFNNKSFFTFGVTDTVSLFPKPIPTPDALIRAIEERQSEYRSNRMQELMKEYSELARQNGEP